MHLLARSTALVALAASLTAAGPAAAADGWSPLQEVGGHALAVALEDGSTALVSIGGDDGATVFDQRRAADGTLGPLTRVTSVRGADSCEPVEAATSRSNFAVAVECRTTTGLEDPPTTLVELVWTGDDGWVWRVQRKASLGSVDYSPRGQYAVFASNSEYGRPHHVTSYHADLGWRDLTRRESGSTGDDMVVAINDAGDVVALRGAGSEDEPGYWYGGRLRLETYDDATRTWTRRTTRSFRDGGIDPLGIDVVGSRFAAAVVESRSTGRLRGREDRIVLLTGRPGDPRTWSSRRWSRQVLTGEAALTDDGVAVASWHALSDGHTARPWFATWPARDRAPDVHDLPGPTTLTEAAASGRAMDLSVSPGGHGAIAWVRHRRGDDHASVAGASFRIGRDGRLGEQVDATWEQQPVGTTVDVTASEASTSATLRRLIAWSYPAPESASSVGP